MTTANQFEIKPATRQNVNPLIVFYSESGCGKTMSALLLARGIAGPNGLIVLGDSESGRGSLYADVIPGGYQTFDLCSPFTPSRYISAIDTMEAAGAAVGILDSCSHEWEGPGGVLDTAMQNEERSGKAGLHNWRIPKLEHAKFVQRLQRAKMPIIVCLRAKHKTRQVKVEGRKAEIVKDDFTSPIQAEDFIFEATCHLEIMPDHTIHMTKPGHPHLLSCFPQDFKEPIGIKHGEAIARWANGSTRPSNAQTVSEPDDLMVQVREAVDAAELNILISQYSALEDGPRKASIKTAIASRAKQLRCTWSDRDKAYTDAQ